MAAERTKAFYRRLLERMSALPGVKSASLASMGLVDGGSSSSGITVEGYTNKCS